MMNFEGLAGVPFNLQGTDGTIYKSQDFAGQWLLLVFHRHLG